MNLMINLSKEFPD